jgi:hypothetical protein
MTEAIRATRHAVKKLLKEEEFDEVEQLNEPLLEGENSFGTTPWK